MTRQPLLDIRNLSISYSAPQGRIKALRDVTLRIGQGEVVGIVGESGCGKSTLISAILRLLSPNARIDAGSIAFGNRDVLSLAPEGLRNMRGTDVAMVFQDPMTAFNPVLTIGRQLVDFQHRQPGSRLDKRKRAATILGRVGIADPHLRLSSYPHELSGGMRQRVAIAAALLMNPALLIADEPTTALDVTMEAQILQLFRDLRRDFAGSIAIVSHHLGVIAELADRVYVMYAGEVVEEGPVDDIFHAPKHPYTQRLLACDPASIETRTTELPTIAGELPDLSGELAGCIFAERCTQRCTQCRTVAPPTVMVKEEHIVRCHGVAV